MIAICAIVSWSLSSFCPSLSASDGASYADAGRKASDPISPAPLAGPQTPPVHPAAAVASPAASSSPMQVLSPEDQAHYHDAFALQRQGYYHDADAALAKTSSPLLRGIVLAERYLGHVSHADYATLCDWLTRYSDAPQAPDIYRLAIVRKPAASDAPLAPRMQGLAKARRIGHGPSMLYNGEASHWEAAIAAYRAHDWASAATHFLAVDADAEDLPSDDRAAAFFWTYRTLNMLGNHQTALHYAAQAAAEPPCFYSILAGQVIGRKKPDAAHLPPLTTLSSLLLRDGAKRAAALSALGEKGLAEQELRLLFASSDAGAKGRKQLAMLAMTLELPGALMHMALLDADGGGKAGNARSLMARWPMPRWMPASGYRLEPALLYAIMRQESGFDPNAKSAGGALGVMQLMPGTIDAMRSRAFSARPSMARGLGSSLDPAVSMTLGQQYIEHLMTTSSVGNNLIFLTAAYNAGPGTLLAWKRKFGSSQDPLLFVESLPYIQTRDYIVRVIGNYWVYSALMGIEDAPSVKSLAEGRWPRYTGSDAAMASMQTHLGGE